jgi:hypothetical protein
VSDRRTPGRRTDVDADKVVAGYQAGRSVRELAAQFDCSYGHVHNVLTTAGVELRSRGGAHDRSRGGARPQPVTLPSTWTAPSAAELILRGLAAAQVEAAPGTWHTVFSGDHAVAKRLVELIRAGRAPFAAGRFEATIRKQWGFPRVEVRCIRPAPTSEGNQ